MSEWCGREGGESRRRAAKPKKQQLGSSVGGSSAKRKTRGARDEAPAIVLPLPCLPLDPAGMAWNTCCTGGGG